MYNTYPQHQNYAPQPNGYGYAPMQQPMPMQQMQPMPVAPSAAASKGLLMVAGIAVVGAAAFGGVFLMNSSSQPEQTAASTPSTVFNVPSEINIPGLNTNSDPASPVVVNNPAPVRVVTPSAPRSTGSSAPVVSAPATGPVQNPAPQNPAPQNPARRARPEGRAEEGRAQEGRAQEGRAEEGRAEEGRAEEGRAEEGRAEEGRACSGPRSQPRWRLP